MKERECGRGRYKREEKRSRTDEVVRGGTDGLFIYHNSAVEMDMDGGFVGSGSLP